MTDHSVSDHIRRAFQLLEDQKEERERHKKALEEQTKRYKNALEDIYSQAQAIGSDEAHIFWSIADEALSGDTTREDEPFHGPCTVPLKAGERWRFSLTPDFLTFALYAPQQDATFTLDEGQHMSRTSHG